MKIVILNKLFYVKNLCFLIFLPYQEILEEVN